MAAPVAVPTRTRRLGAVAGCRGVVSLDPLHEWVARIVFDLPQARHLAIAGGNAMLAHHLVVRPTQDLDLFTPVPSEVDPLVVALAEALRAKDARVEVDRRGLGFSRLTVETVEGRQVAVEIAHDARLRESVQLDIGRVFHSDEVAADKTLAILGRAAARDLVDVDALSDHDRYPLESCVPWRGRRTPASIHAARRCDERGDRAPQRRLCRARALRRGNQSATQQGPRMAHHFARRQHRGRDAPRNYRTAAASGRPTISNPSPTSRG